MKAAAPGGAVSSRAPEDLKPVPFSLADVAVVIPCLNEEAAIFDLVEGLKVHVPEAEIWVLDNHSTDQTVARAKAAGAKVAQVKEQGKGHVLAFAFAQLKDRVILMLDGDMTYLPQDAMAVLSPVLSGKAEVCVGVRNRKQDSGMSFVRSLGNHLILRWINGLAGTRHQDVLSGYRAFSPRVLSELSLEEPGFGVETELTFKVKACGFEVAEVPVSYGSRPDGSFSKLRIFKDGLHILRTAWRLRKQLL